MWFSLLDTSTTFIKRSYLFCYWKTVHFVITQCRINRYLKYMIFYIHTFKIWRCTMNGMNHPCWCHILRFYTASLDCIIRTPWHTFSIKYTYSDEVHICNFVLVFGFRTVALSDTLWLCLLKIAGKKGFDLVEKGRRQRRMENLKFWFWTSIKMLPDHLIIPYISPKFW